MQAYFARKCVVFWMWNDTKAILTKADVNGEMKYFAIDYKYLDEEGRLKLNQAFSILRLFIGWYKWRFYAAFHTLVILTLYKIS